MYYPENEQFAPENRPFAAESIVFQPGFLFRYAIVAGGGGIFCSIYLSLYLTDKVANEHEKIELVSIMNSAGEVITSPQLAQHQPSANPFGSSK